MKKGTAIWSQAYYKNTNALNILIRLRFEYYMKYPRSVNQRLKKIYKDIKISFTIRNHYEQNTT